MIKESTHIKPVIGTQIEMGMTARTVKEIMGHTNYNTTVSYTHCLVNMKQKEARKVGNFFDTSTQTDKKVAYDNLIGIIKKKILRNK